MSTYCMPWMFTGAIVEQTKDDSHPESIWNLTRRTHKPPPQRRMHSVAEPGRLEKLWRRFGGGQGPSEARKRGGYI